MSIIQRIRDRAAWLIFGAIALAMIGFIVTDAFQGGGGGWLNSQSTTIGKVNGKKLDYLDYQNRLKAQEQQYQAGMDDATRESLQDGVWEQMVEEAVMMDQYESLGLNISDKEVGDILYGNNPPDQLRRQFTNPQTQQYDPNMAFQTIQEFKKRSPKEYNDFIESMIGARQREKYLALLTNTVYVPRWMMEKSNAENSQLASISYVNAPYISVSDSSVQVTDDDIKSYIGKRLDEFKQEESRTIKYVAFSAAPSTADTLAVRQQMEKFRTEFDTTSDHQAFMARNGSDLEFSDIFVTQTNLQVPFKDTITALGQGSVYGPYMDGKNFVLAKMIEKRNMPDSIKVRHILISTASGVPDSVAKRRIDSISNAIAGGADFRALAAQVSDDPGSKNNGGEYDFSSLQTNLAKEFYDASFFGNKGDKKTIKTTFGYHYVEVLDQKQFVPGYKVAYFTKGIYPSSETESRASGLANQFSGQSRSAKAFDDNVAKNGYVPLIASDIKPTAIVIPNLGSNRQFVRWIYEADKGDVSEVYSIDDKHVVAVITEINEEGTMSPQKARPIVETLVRNEKKAEQLKKKLGTPATLEAAATASGQPIQKADSISFAGAFIPNMGQEMKLLGAAFNKDWRGKVSQPISGNTGVYVIRTETVFAGPNPSADIEQQRAMMVDQQRQSTRFRIIDVNKKSATIKDNRAKFL